MSFGMCLDRESFSFQDENILVLNIFMATEQFCVKINENRLEFSNTTPIKFQSQQIRQFELHFLSDQQIAPSFTINDKLFVLVAPKILLTPQLSVPRV